MKNNIRYLREERELTLRQLADLVDPPMSHAQLQKLETGERKLSPKWKKRLALALGCDPEDFTYNDNIKKLVSYSTIGGLFTVPLIGFIDSEGIVKLFDTEEKLLEKVECPPSLDAQKTKAYRLFIRDMGWMAFIEEVSSGMAMPGVPPEFIKKLCIVTISQPEIGDQTLCKFIERGSKPGHYDLHGLDSSEKVLKDCLIKSSLFVEDMRQKK